MSSEILKRNFPRSRAVVVLQGPISKASLAALIATMTSSRLASWTVAKCSAFAGSKISLLDRDFDSTHSPLTYIR